jgi:hypothetical protein
LIAPPEVVVVPADEPLVADAPNFGDEKQEIIR